MVRSVVGILVAVSVGSAATAPALAHHSFAAAFDADKPVTVRGVIVEAKLANPHSWIYLDVTDAAGSVARWGFEAQTPTARIRSGVKPDVFRVGSEVTIRGVHARDMTRNEGAAREIVVFRLKAQATALHMIARAVLPCCPASICGRHAASEPTPNPVS